MKYNVVVERGFTDTSIFDGLVMADRYEVNDRIFVLELSSSERLDLLALDGVIGVDSLEEMKANETLHVSTVVERSSQAIGSGYINRNSANWGLLRHSNDANPFALVDTEYTQDFVQNYDGTGVDLVCICQAMVDITNPSYETLGVSRIQEFQWNTLPGLSAMETINYNTGSASTHAEAILAVAASNENGWATGADIYLVPRDQISNTSHYFDAVRVFHEQKSNSRPTVAFGAWGYAAVNQGALTSISFRGNTYTTYQGVDLAAQRGNYAAPDNFGAKIAFKMSDYSSVPVAVESMTNSGVHFAISAGNESGKVDHAGGLDYDNSRVLYGNTEYYSRETSVSSDDTLIVANLASSFDEAGDGEQLWHTSNRGPRVDCCAAGTFLNIPIPTSSSNTVTGTSFSSPQIAGMLAMVVGKYPTTTPAQGRKFFRETAVSSETLENWESPAMYVGSSDYGDEQYFAPSLGLQGYSGNITYLDPTIPFDPSTIVDTTITYPSEVTTSESARNGIPIREPVSGRLSFTLAEIDLILASA